MDGRREGRTDEHTELRIKRGLLKYNCLRFIFGRGKQRSVQQITVKHWLWSNPVVKGGFRDSVGGGCLDFAPPPTSNMVQHPN